MMTLPWFFDWSGGKFKTAILLRLTARCNCSLGAGLVSSYVRPKSDIAAA